VTAVLRAEAEHNPSQRDQHILSIAARGRLGWQEDTDYGQRALIETAMGRYKAIIGPRLRARSSSGQQAEAAGAVAVLNRMLHAGRPDSVRRLNIAAQIGWEKGKLGPRSIHATTPSRSVLFPDNCSSFKRRSSEFCHSNVIPALAITPRSLNPVHW